MHPQKMIGKREFVQHTSKYIQWVDDNDTALVITHHKHPALMLSKIKQERLQDLRGTIQIKIHGDVNDPILPGYDEWLF